jgi:TRAP-type C4-dicarboxylate transport system substrate-binding protein
MKKTLVVLFTLAFVFTGLSTGAAKTKWDMHLNYPAGNFHSKGAQEFADKVFQVTNGELEIVLHPEGALGFKGPELLRALDSGRLVIAEVPTGMVEEDAPLMALTAQPFIAHNSEEQRLLYELALPVYVKELEKFNQITLFSSVWPFSGLFTQRPIGSVADLQGLKMRVYDGTGAAFGEMTGIDTRKMAFSQVHKAMKAGLLDSLYTSSVSGVDARAWEVTRYFIPINIVGPVNLYNVNKKAWDKLPRDIQGKIMAVARETESKLWAMAAEMDRKSRVVLKEKGIQVLEVSHTFRRQLDKIGDQLRTDWIKKAGPQAGEILDRYYQKSGQK